MTSNKNKYIYLGIGYLGLILMGLGLIRYVSAINDTLGLVLGLLGYILVVTFFEFVENMMNITTKIKFLFRFGYIVILALFLLTYL